LISVPGSIARSHDQAFRYGLKTEMLVFVPVSCGLPSLISFTAEDQRQSELSSGGKRVYRVLGRGGRRVSCSGSRQPRILKLTHQGATPDSKQSARVSCSGSRRPRQPSVPSLARVPRRRHTGTCPIDTCVLHSDSTCTASFFQKPQTR